MAFLKDIYDIVKDFFGQHMIGAPSVYLKRTEIDWKPFNDNVRFRYWACGTSLIPIADHVLVPLLDKEIKDIKIVLPNTKKGFTSYFQLKEFDRTQTGPVGGQINLAKATYDRIADTFEQRNITIKDHLRKYSGIMYSNITIYDEDALISFYDTTGIGDKNITMKFHGMETEGYRLVKNEFERMWSANKYLGRIGANSKPKGTSILFLNNQNQVLLFLRDNNAFIPYPNCWDILGGNVKKDENPKQCIIREIGEEIGRNIKTLQLFDVYDLKDRIEYTYWEKANLDIEEITLTEGQRLKWFTEEEIRGLSEEKMAFNFKQIILTFYEEAPFKQPGKTTNSDSN